MEKALKLSSAKLPQGDANGLADREVVRAIMSDPQRMRVGIFLFNMPKTEIDLEADMETGKLTIRRVEVILSDRYGDASALERLLLRAYEARTGRATLDSELEDELREVFRSINLADTDPAAKPPAEADRDDEE